MPETTLALLARSWRSWLSADLQRAGPYWLQLLWTALFCLVLAAVFTLLGFALYTRGSAGWGQAAVWATWYGRNLVVCCVVGYTIHGLYELTGRLWLGQARLRRLAGWRRSAYFAGVPLVGMVLGWPLGVWLVDAQLLRSLLTPSGRNLLLVSLTLSLLASLAVHLWFSAKARQLAAEQQATEARLRLLQGQMEPHFLFNTLATVRSLSDDDLPRAQQMLDSFTDYLRASVGQLRAEDTTLGDELALVRAYLQLMQQRMEDRLRFSLDVPEALLSLRLPALLLQPLVENAIHHGLEPQVQGGQVRVQAQMQPRRDGSQVVLTVADDGRGLGQPSGRPGSGVALANLRQRLAGHYGDAASLTLAPGQPGTVATLTLPWPA